MKTVHSRSNPDKTLFDFWIILAIIFILGFSFGLEVVFTISGERIYAWLVTLLSFGLVYLFYYYIRDIYFRIKGLIGEYKVSIILNEMWPDGVRSLNDIVLSKKGNVDHVAIAKTGVWTIETKESNVSLKKCSQVKSHDLKQAYAEMMKVKEKLLELGITKMEVKPILVYSGDHAKVRLGQSPVEGVIVVGRLGLRKVIADEEHGNILSQEDIQNIFEKLKPYSNIGA
jgi:hypothetical protein